MFIYVNALKNLLRNKGRNILVSVILLIVMTATTVSFAVSSISDAMIDQYKGGFGVETTIIEDYEYANAHAKTEKVTLPNGRESTRVTFVQEQFLTMEMYMEYANSEYVQDTLFSAYADYASDSLDSISKFALPSTLEGLLAFFNRESREDLVQFLGSGNKEEGEKRLEDLIDAKPNRIGEIYGYSNASMMTDFRRNEKRLTEGRLFEGIGEVLITVAFAEHNNIKLGDIITISGTSKTHDTATIDLTVVGIYEDLKGNLNDDMNTFIDDTDKDKLIVSFDTLIQSGIYRITPGVCTYFLIDAEAPGAFLQECRKKGLHKSYTLDYDNESYNKIVEPVKDMAGIAVTFGIVILITGAVILIFLSVINIRERKYEIGVLRAIGMKKHRLARGMIYESLSLVTICTLIGLPLGWFLAKPIAGMLLDTSESINVATSFNVGLLPLILLTAVTLGVISSIIGIIYITRYEPMKILQERN